MSAPRLVGLCVTALLAGLVTISVDSGPAAGQAPQIKPGGQPKGLPQIKPPAGGALPGGGLNPGGVPVPPGGGVNPGAVPPVMNPPGGGGGGFGDQAMPRKDPGDWPKEIGGKKLSEILKEIKTNPDASIREAAVRTLPMFGPPAQEKGGETLVYALTKDVDINVRLAALSVVPVVGFFEDKDAKDGMAAVFALLENSSSHIRFEATLVVGAIGPLAKSAIPKLITRAGDGSSWRLRKAAVFALGQVGQENPADPDDAADVAAVATLLRNLKLDPSAPVRREAVNSLTVVGRVSAPQLKAWRDGLEAAVKNDKDRSIPLWVRVCLVRNDPMGTKTSEHLTAIGEMLNDKLPAARGEACQALGALGDKASSQLQALLDLVGDGTQPIPVVIAGVMALAAMPSQAAKTVPILTGMQQAHKNEEVKRYAAEAVRILTTPKKNPPAAPKMN